MNKITTAPAERRALRGNDAAFRPAAWRIDDGAAQLGVSRSSIYKMAGKGKIRLLKIAGRSLIPDAEIQRLTSEGA